MKEANEIREELKSMDSILADMPRAMPYCVPDGYFSELAGNVHQTIKNISEQEDLPVWSKTMPFGVPQGYFDQLSNEIVAKSMATDLPAAIPFAVPQGYFNKLPQQILQTAKAADKPVARLISLQRKTILSQLRWAAAAMLVTGIGLGGYHTYQQQQISNTENILSAVPAGELQAYVQGTYRINVDEMTGNTNVSNMQVDNKDIIQYLNETGWD